MQWRKWFRSRQPDHAPARLLATNITRRNTLATHVEVADSGAARSRGLLGRKGLAHGEALWIVPCEAIHTFGMQFSLDLVYLDREYRIKKIRQDVPPWRFSACLTAHSVLELPAGALQGLQVSVGDIIAFSPAVQKPAERPS
jgi:uncharacterized membrane protein (UPF0127 family)